MIRYFVDRPVAAATPAVHDRPDLACRAPDVDPEIFYPGSHQSPAPAQDVCDRCPAKDECLQWALDTDQKFGIFGGVIAEDRIRMRRARSVSA